MYSAKTSSKNHPKNHPNIIKIKENFKNLDPFDFPKPTLEDNHKILKL